MTDHLFIPQAAAIPSPTEVASYLVQLGWKLEKADSALHAGVAGRVAHLFRGAARREAIVRRHIHKSTSARGLLHRAGRFGVWLVAVEDVHLQTPAGLDIVRIAFEGSATKDGRISVKAGQKVYAAARDLLLSAACSVLEPRAVFTKRKPDDAMNLLDRARFSICWRRK